MSRPRTERFARLAAGLIALAGLGALQAGCSDLYWDRRETVALSGGDAIAANAAMQMVDPWPPRSGDKNIAFEGQRMEAAVERYRTNKVTPPVDPENFISTNQTAQTVTQNTYTGVPPPTQ